MKRCALYSTKHEWRNSHYPETPRGTSLKKKRILCIPKSNSKDIGPWGHSCTTGSTNLDLYSISGLLVVWPIFINDCSLIDLCFLCCRLKHPNWSSKQLIIFSINTEWIPTMRQGPSYMWTKEKQLPLPHTAYSSQLSLFWFPILSTSPTITYTLL